MSVISGSSPPQILEWLVAEGSSQSLQDRFAGPPGAREEHCAKTNSCALDSAANLPPTPNTSCGFHHVSFLVRFHYLRRKGRIKRLSKLLFERHIVDGQECR